MNKFQKNFIDFRVKRNLTQKDVAHILETTQGTISKIERGYLIPRSDLYDRLLRKENHTRKK
jgi:transcriptional regulator with XRE-family HTH domain